VIHRYWKDHQTDAHTKNLGKYVTSHLMIKQFDPHPSLVDAFPIKFVFWTSSTLPGRAFIFGHCLSLTIEAAHLCPSPNFGPIPWPIRAVFDEGPFPEFDVLALFDFAGHFYVLVLGTAAGRWIP
jgi:hypothetical protein